MAEPPRTPLDRIDDVDRDLKQWAETVLEGAASTLQLPEAEGQGQGVSLYLLDLVDKPPARGAERPPLQFTLRYLVTTWGKEPEEAHHLLGELACAALARPDLEVEFATVPAEMWSALGLAPRPSFMLRVPFRRLRPAPPPRRVRQPLVVETGPLVQLRGVVVGPGDVPIAGARVELPAQRLAVRTDAAGAFTFTTVASAPQPVRVRAKGHEVEATLAPPPHEEPITIRFDAFD